MHPLIHLGGITIPAYGLCMVTGIVLASFLASIFAAKKGLPLDHLLALIACSVGIGVLGSKVFYVFVSYSLPEMWEKLIHGGFSNLETSGAVYFGGLITGVAGAFGIASILKISLKDYAGVIVPFIPLAHAFGRVGCFLAGCCYGIPYKGVCSVQYPIISNGIASLANLFPVQILEALINLLVFGFLLAISAKRTSRDYFVLVQYCLLYSMQRFFIEFLRGDVQRGMLLSLSTSQWISIIVFIASLLSIIQMKLSSAKGGPSGKI